MGRYQATPLAPTVGMPVGDVPSVGGFGSGASFNSLAAATGGAARPVLGSRFNNMSGQFHVPRYQEWSLQLDNSWIARAR